MNQDRFVVVVLVVVFAAVVVGYHELSRLRVTFVDVAAVCDKHTIFILRF